VSSSEAPIQETAREEAASERALLLTRMPRVNLGVSGAIDQELEVTLDGAVVPIEQLGQPRSINPGRHVYAVQRGSVHRQVSFDMREGEHRELWLALEPEPRVSVPEARATGRAEREADETYRTLRTAGWITLGASGVSLMTGSIAYFVGKSHYTSLERRALCVNNDCPASEVDAYNHWRTVHLAGLLSGGLLGAAGLTLIIAGGADSNESEPRSSVSLRLEPGSFTLGGRF